MSIQNPMCDGGHCRAPGGEVRVLPLSSNPDNGNLILCRACFEHEINFRRDRNRELAPYCKFLLPAWESLETYPRKEQ